MYLQKLLLQNFRSYDQKIFDFTPQVNLVLGPNGSGKTNILEAVYLLAAIKSFRASSLGKLIKWEQPFSSLRAKINNKNQLSEIEVRLINDPGRISTARKLLIDQVAKTRKAYLGVFKVVVFQPEDIRLVTSSPTRRREFLDSIFSTTQWRYASALSQYNRALKHRNELLDQIRAGTNTKNELFYWDQSLVKNAAVIHDFRVAFVRSANNFFANHPDPEIRCLSLNYQPSALSQEKLDRNYDFDLLRGYTQAGIHRDDFSFDSSVFPFSDKNLANWGSRGQQRLAVLALRLAQINYMENTFNEAPVLLLDDIFSELDAGHQQLVASLCQKYQTIFTSSEDASLNILPDAHIIRL